MSTSAISSTSLYQELQQYFQTRQTDLKHLGQDLAAGNASAAQTDFQDIATLGQSGPFANGNPFGAVQREQDFTAIGQALQSGNLNAAQQAFSNLEATFQRNPNVQNPITTAPTPSTSAPTGSGGGPEIVLNIGSNSGGSAGPVTIDITNQSGGGEQLSISYGAQGSNAQPVILNLAPNSNEEIVLNLLGPTSSSQASSSSTGGTTTGSSTTGGLNISA